MSMWTEEEFYKYKGDEQFIEVSYYGKATIRSHVTYEEYLEAFNELCEQDTVTIPRDLLLYLQERVDPQNEYPIWMIINKYLEWSNDELED